jgi:phosphoribosyl 1,2-cyclic phosphate phosphodiesterase
MMLMGENYRAILLGCGSSGGVPRADGGWGNAHRANVRNRRKRCGLLVQRRRPGEPWHPSTTTNCLIDTPPDLAHALAPWCIEKVDGVVWTHAHADQLHGLDDVRTLRYRQDGPIPAFADAPTHQRIETAFDYVINGARGYPSLYQLADPICADDRLTIDGSGGPICLQTVRVQHGTIENLAIRLNRFAYLNDADQVEAEDLAKLRGIEHLVVDCLRYDPHPSHAHLDQAMAWADELNPRRVWLTNLHIDLDYDDLSSRLPDHVQPCFDGQVIAWSD